MIRKGFAGRTATLEGRDGRGLRDHLRRDLILGRSRLELLELQLHLVDQAGPALGAVTILLAPQPGDLEPEMFDHRLGGRDHGPGVRQFRFGGLGTRLRGRERGAQSGDLGGGV